ncbi:prolactin-inducible protein isoform X2 [Macaca fascicularis]|uniref:prolactin-inducible protein isoform X2 n=1 Tax=Macaca fascicularis TaxID=9541 RepID=UPI0032B03D00
MRLLQFLFRASPATLLLVLCLHLGANKAQENTRRIIIQNFEIPTTANRDEEVTAVLQVKTELKECMVAKVYLTSDVPVEGAFNYKYTRCLCDDYPNTYYWDFHTNIIPVQENELSWIWE